MKKIRASITVTVLLTVAVSIVYINQFSSKYVGLLMLMASSPMPAPKPLCSMQLIYETVRSRQDGFVSGNGTWSRHDNRIIDRFHPSVCRLRHGINLPPAELVRCLRRRLNSTRSIVIAGDSNANRYYAAFRLLMTSAGANCTTVQIDHSQSHGVDTAYYSFNRTSMSPMIVHERDCAGCTNEKMECEFSNMSVIIERLTLEFTNDAEVTSLLTYRNCMAQRTVKFSICPVSTTSQQFILKEYLASTPPDLMIVFGNAHDSYRFTLREHAMNVRYFADMLDIYLPPSTTVVWTSKPSEYANRKPASFQGLVYELGTMNITQWLKEANQIQFREMRSRMLANKRPMMFIDLQEMSNPVQADWSLDGIHMNPLWYQHVVSYLLQTLCA